jgi:DNA (cytosine-5)-methyltransferase 1
MAGDQDERHLWPEFARIIREIRPRYAVLENVAAHLALGFGDVLRDLAELGYDAEWSVLSACRLGAPHTRERLFCIAYPAAQRSVTCSESVQARGLSLEYRGEAWRDGVFGLDQSPVVGDRYGIPNLTHRNESLGNAVVPQVAEVVGRLIMEFERQRCAA